MQEEVESGDGSNEFAYDIVYIDADETPELVIAANGNWVSLYTYADGQLYELMDRWTYGVAGNHGYDFVERGNLISNYNTDYAGGISYYSVYKMTIDHKLEWISTNITYNCFEDKNGNEVFDEDEADTFGTGNYSYSTYEENEGIQETDILPGIESNESKTLFGRKRIDEIIQELDALDLE